MSTTAPDWFGVARARAHDAHAREGPLIPPEAPLVMSRAWAMPNRRTFSIKPIADLLARVVGPSERWLDPFANEARIATITNDLNPSMGTDFNEDARDFLGLFKDDQADGILYDPPYTLRQVKECYDGIGIAMTQHDTQHLFSEIRDGIARATRLGGLVVSFGYSTVGIGKSRGFRLEEVLLVCHGGIHHDTIVTVERKVKEVEI